MGIQSQTFYKKVLENSTCLFLVQSPSFHEESLWECWKVALEMQSRSFWKIALVVFDGKVEDSMEECSKNNTYLSLERNGLQSRLENDTCVLWSAKSCKVEVSMEES